MTNLQPLRSVLGIFPLLSGSLRSPRITLIGKPCALKQQRCTKRWEKNVLSTIASIKHHSFSGQIPGFRKVDPTESWQLGHRTKKKKKKTVYTVFCKAYLWCLISSGTLLANIQVMCNPISTFSEVSANHCVTRFTRGTKSSCLETNMGTMVHMYSDAAFLNVVRGDFFLIFFIIMCKHMFLSDFRTCTP